MYHSISYEGSGGAIRCILAPRSGARRRDIRLGYVPRLVIHRGEWRHWWTDSPAALQRRLDMASEFNTVDILGYTGAVAF